ncbi:MAG: hypothetical protein JW987_16445 [Anaerolineaceae bacterium]|nr:hypothetical protein [Anaerolineaceae bacterium]
MHPVTSPASPDGCATGAGTHYGGSHNCTNGTSSYTIAQRGHGACPYMDGWSFSNAGLVG